MSIPESLSSVNQLTAKLLKGDPYIHNDLIKSIRELQLAVEMPGNTISSFNFQMMHNVCIRVAIEYHMLEALVDRQGEPTSTDEIAKTTGSDHFLVIRVMRILAAIGLCDEVEKQTYIPNERTKLFVTPGKTGAAKYHFDMTFKIGAHLVDYMRGPGIKQFSDNPEDITIYKYIFGVENAFDLMNTNPDQKTAFDLCMASRRMDNLPQWFDVYPVSETVTNLRNGSDEVLIVDIGGGPGQELANFHERYPDIPGRLVLQDLPLTLNGIETLPSKVEAMKYDFFYPQPIKGARFYYLRDIFHSWSDKKSLQILNRISEAMDSEYSTLLIVDYVLPDTNVDLRPAEMDILMWLHNSGMKRTLSQWKALLEAGELTLVQIWYSPDERESVMEIRKRVM